MDNITVANVSGKAHGGLHVLTDYELGLWFTLYGLISVLAVFGNLLVIYIIISRPKMHSVTNYFIINLAVGDTLTGMLAIPFKFQAALLQKWFLPSFMCQTVPFIETVSLSVSVFTLTGTAVDRFRAVVFPMRSKMTQMSAQIIIFLIWAVSIAMSLPYGLYHQVFPVFNDSETIIYACYPAYGDQMWWKVYNIYLTIIQYFVPLFIVNGAYGVIGYNVLLTESQISQHDPRSEAFQRSKRRVIKMLVIVVMVFTFCWLPYETYLVLNELRPNINEFYYINVIFFCSHWLAMSNSCLNPIIYGIYNEKFQKEYKRVLRRCCGQQYDDMTEIRLESYAGDGTSPCMSNSNSKIKTPFMAERREAEAANSTHFYIASELGKDDD